MALKKLNGVTDAPKSTKNDVPVVNIKGNSISRYNAAKVQLDEAEAIVKELEPEIKQAGLRHIFAHNVAMPVDPWTSVKLEDASGERARVSATSRYTIANSDVVEEAFSKLGKEVSDYAHFVTKSSFDDKVFIVNNEFDQAVYDAYKTAIDGVTAALKAAGKLSVAAASPLSSKQIVAPKPDFHTKRWTAFPTVEEQSTLQAALPMVISAAAGVK